MHSQRSISCFQLSALSTLDNKPRNINSGIIIWSPGSILWDQFISWKAVPVVGTPVKVLWESQAEEDTIVEPGKMGNRQMARSALKYRDRTYWVTDWWGPGGTEGPGLGVSSESSVSMVTLARVSASGALEKEWYCIATVSGACGGTCGWSVVEFAEAVWLHRKLGLSRSEKVGSSYPATRSSQLWICPWGGTVFWDKAAGSIVGLFRNRAFLTNASAMRSVSSFCTNWSRMVRTTWYLCNPRW